MANMLASKYLWMLYCCHLHAKWCCRILNSSRIWVTGHLFPIQARFTLFFHGVDLKVRKILLCLHMISQNHLWKRWEGICFDNSNNLSCGFICNMICLKNRVMLDTLSVQGNGLPWENKTEQLFWRGRDSRRERLDLIDISRKHPKLFNVSITNFFFFRDEMDKYGPAQNHVSFFNFFKVNIKAVPFCNKIDLSQVWRIFHYIVEFSFLFFKIYINFFLLYIQILKNVNNI